ncbi:hypothetical protein GOBAR_DD12421 [Gossypium barbadense]|nr:hypothetical protein GOBAR_DD12421 [Gossypium barbadense]
MDSHHIWIEEGGLVGWVLYEGCTEVKARQAQLESVLASDDQELAKFCQMQKATALQGKKSVESASDWESKYCTL